MTQENKITGKITVINKPEDISSGKYRKLVFAVTNNGGYDGKEQMFAFEIFEKADGEKIANFLKFNKVGQTVDVSYEIRCSEHSGRYFTSLSAWKVFANKDAGTATVGTATVDAPIVDTAIEDEPPF